MRVDARRNRDRVLAEARRLIAERGEVVGMDDIAAAAGLAVGTLYRHFPTKTQLVGAVFEEAMSSMADDVERTLAVVQGGADPSVELSALFARLAERHSTDLALKAAAGAAGLAVPVDLRTEQSPQTARAYAAFTALLGRSLAAGTIRTGTTLDDLVLLLDGVPQADSGAEARHRYVEIVWRGLTA